MIIIINRKMSGGIGMSRLVLEEVTVSYDEQPIVDQLSLQIPDGKVTALIGANGSGKSTILKTIARLLKPQRGHVYLDGKSIQRMNTKQAAKQLAILPQHPTVPEGLTVGELISFGRYPHQSGLGTMTKEDRSMVAWALEVTGLEEYADRPLDHMSGGQRQRAWIAMALAQGTDFLLLDEPTTYLDLAHQLEVLQLLRRLNREEGKTIVMVVHDLNHASLFADHIAAIKRGAVISQGKPSEVLTPERIRAVFDIEADIIQCPRTGAPLCLPFALSKSASVAQAFVSGGTR